MTDILGRKWPCLATKCAARAVFRNLMDTLFCFWSSKKKKNHPANFNFSKEGMFVVSTDNVGSK